MIFRFGDYEIDSGRYELRRAGENTPVEPKVLDLLIYLAREHGRLVCKEELLAAVWPGVNVSESALTRAVSLARSALGDSAQSQGVIETVSGRGYRWKVAPEVEAPAALAARGRTPRRLAWASALLAPVALTALVWPRPLGWLFALTGSASPPASPAATAEPSLVVLPFLDLGGADATPHLADGITELRGRGERTQQRRSARGDESPDRDGIRRAGLGRSLRHTTRRSVLRPGPIDGADRGSARRVDRSRRARAAAGAPDAGAPREVPRCVPGGGSSLASAPGSHAAASVCCGPHGGSAMGEPPKQLAEAYAGWLDAQRKALALMTALEQPGTPQDWAEGYRWLTRMASLCEDWVLEKEDPLRPTIFRNQDAYRKLIVDNPDVNYWFVSVTPEHAYRLSGNRGTAPYLGFTIGTDVIRGAPGRTGTLAQHYIDQFEVAPDGAFEIVAAGARPAGHTGNFMALPEGTAQIAVRETFTDRRTQRPALLHIERLGAPVPPPRAEPEVIAEKLRAMSRYLLVIAHTCAMLWKSSAANTNRIVGVAGAQHVRKQENEVNTHSDTDMVYMGGRFSLGEGEALRITMHKPPYPFVYWGLVLVNPWMESYDFRFATTHLSNGTAVPDANGDWTLLVAPENPGPGARNWLDAGGRREGFMLLRWVLAGDAPPQPSCEVVKVASLRG